jgi:hypothetical protein
VDHLGFWTSGAPSRLTVPAGFSGLIRLSGYVVWDNNATGRRHMRFSRNGATTIQAFFGTTGGANEGGRDFSTRWFAATAADYYELDGFQDSGGTRTVQGGGFAGPSWFQVEALPL